MTNWVSQRRTSFVVFIKLKLVSFFIAGDFDIGGNNLTSGVGLHTIHISWWLKQSISIFLKSGLWSGYWSPLCEEWFQGCLCQVQEHTAQLNKSMKWPNTLKYSNPKTKSVVFTNATASEAYLKHLTKGPGADLVACKQTRVTTMQETCIINLTLQLILNLINSP